MNTKEAIEFVKRLCYDKYKNAIKNKLSPSSILEIKIQINEVISLLQQGEALKAENVELKAYKQIWEELKFDYVCHIGWCEAESIKELEQKYFPKSVKKTITKEVIK